MKTQTIRCNGHEATATFRRDPFNPDYKEMVIGSHLDGNGNRCPESDRVY